ncbi:transcription factor [Methanomicrobiaceae archaeon CYW5]|uniref:transcription factor n=1 Tax=Methanovulcanius yangii TaxID=1789227 RepID=UPI0029CA6E03|nr:transcription factor [Methanovulcanius yangii]MBT8507769.1 transcription factor [Methanovulcanius yangii]
MVTAEEAIQNEAVRAYLMRMIGEAGLALVEDFGFEIEKTDEELAEETGINLNTVRNTLYTLYGKRLAEYRREKNQETGWLTYKWKLRLDRIDDAITEDMEEVLEKLQARERYEDENDFYICKNCGIVYTFDEALLREFTCSCDTPMDHFDNELILQALKRRVEQMKASLGKV